MGSFLRLQRAYLIALCDKENSNTQGETAKTVFFLLFFLVPLYSHECDDTFVARNGAYRNVA